MTKVIMYVDFQVKPEKLEEWKKVAPEIIALSRAEPGTETFIGMSRLSTHLCVCVPTAYQ
jgi:quinol monooxygenase YgiN